ncbi:MAG: ribosome biogenesis GTP-binding protein YsxC [Planctomycetes bacterium]|nr:ribosome biogenesis GTP-binding protein YsxC [Planctomycetota bacterium]
MKSPTVLTAEFAASAPTVDALPPAGAVEIAFAGRSNVGKSSLTNSLLGRRKLVRTSSRPGCTRAADFFRVVVEPRGGAGGRSELCFVDLPGFGYAQVSRQERQAWVGLLNGYFSSDRPLAAVVLICDARRGPEEEEREMVARLQELGRDIVPVVTKIDKLPRHAHERAARETAASLQLPSAIAWSSVTGEGRDRLWGRLLELAFPP